MEISIIRKTDKQIATLIEQEERRQQETINLIASENYPSRAVREALSSVFVAKYSEGRPYRRYYGGMEYIDKLETLVEERVRKVFKIGEKWAVNVQPYSGSPANYAIERGLLGKKGKILSVELSHGGHLTHGSPVSASGMDFTVKHYPMSRETMQIDYDEVERIARKVKPDLIITGYTAYPRAVNFARMAKIAKSVEAYLLADISHITGLVVGGAHASPFPHADVVMTTTHKSLRGPRGAMIVCREELAEKIFPAVFPGLQGGPHNHTIAALELRLPRL